MIDTSTGGAGANDLAADGATGMGSGFESALKAFLGRAGIVGENVADAGDRFEAGKSKINKMTIWGSGKRYRRTRRR